MQVIFSDLVRVGQTVMDWKEGWPACEDMVRAL